MYSNGKWVYLVITANFEESLYRVPEDSRSVAPKLNLTRPSSCNFTIHAQLVVYGELIDIHIRLIIVV